MPHIVDKIAEALHLKGHHQKQEGHAEEAKPVDTSATSSDGAVNGVPVFDAAKITVIFVLGGPGAGPKIYLIPFRCRLLTSHHR